ncbi:hypothetical protein P691DRAFT_780279 [Macrolepiota fuliginosa MF-IS2]|uniref:Uncharacterized protein n=1 Tax=Macrolepiota fuliginosa MF-IS2 TaxID=1400762 RepID=A0A9P5XQK5_9AGAR|nr:hypothetical protein P691DRAFT_780279 [Macrolepiota fuliginosa MF-IS2]
MHLSWEIIWGLDGASPGTWLCAGALIVSPRPTHRYGGQDWVQDKSSMREGLVYASGVSGRQTLNSFLGDVYQMDVLGRFDDALPNNALRASIFFSFQTEDIEERSTLDSQISSRGAAGGGEASALGAYV